MSNKLKDIDCPTCKGDGAVIENGKAIICPTCKGMSYIYIEDEPKKRKTKIGNDHYDRIN